MRARVVGVIKIYGDPQFPSIAETEGRRLAPVSQCIVVGSHEIWGAELDPRAEQELLPHWDRENSAQARAHPVSILYFGWNMVSPIPPLAPLALRRGQC